MSYPHMNNSIPLHPRRKNLPHRQQQHRMTVVDLFSGAGGTGVGFKKAGFTIVGAVEVNHAAAKTYENNLKVKVKKDDITTVSPQRLRREFKLRPRELDVLVGCPPCQGFSRMRNNEGRKDPRNKLVLQYLDFVKEFMPRFAVFENVPGLVRTKHGKKFYDALYAGLEELGYKVERRVDNVADYGVPQHRRRIIVIAGRNGEEPPFPSPTHGNPKSIEVLNGKLNKWVTVRDVIGRGRYPRLKAGENGEGKRKQKYPNHVAPEMSEKVLKFIQRVPRNGGSRIQVQKRYWLECHKTHNGHADVYGRLEWDAPSNTITCGCTNVSKGRFVHPTQDRAVTPREAASLQGFDIQFIFEADTACAQIGNAVPPPYALAIAKALRRRIRACAPRRRRRTPYVRGTVRNGDVQGGRSGARNLTVFPARGRRRLALARAA
jgi:DNA (cytosine-5)-methyltransferase 1